MSINTSTNQTTAGIVRPRARNIALGLGLLLTPVLISVVAFTSTARALDTIGTTVLPEDVRPISDVELGPAGWYKTTVGTGSVELTNAVPYNVAGSAEFNVSDASSYAELGLYKNFTFERLVDQEALDYATWQVADNTKAVSFQVGVDMDVEDSDTTWQGRLVYEPYLNTDFNGNPVTDGQWQTWLTNDPEAVWWMTWSSSLTSRFGDNPCPQANPCTYSEILGIFPNVGFNVDFGSPIILKAGSGWDSFTGYADAPAVGTATVVNFWDFEPGFIAPTGPTSKDECKNDGWLTFGPQFKNQGACVSYATRL